MRGKFQDQYESAAFNGELQFRESEKIEFEESTARELDFHHLFLDMGLEVGPPAHGVAFFKGTLEGPGISAGLGMIVSLLSRFVKTMELIKDPKKNSEFYKKQGKKNILLDHRNGSFLALPLDVWKHIPPLPEPTLEAFRKTARVGALTTLPWVPTILPFQVLRLGDTVIAFVPGEISTMSGRRLKKMMAEKLCHIGVKNIIISSYANAYMGYIVTPEEYDKQCYEGGHCVYGRDTLQGILKGFSYLCDRLQGKVIPTNLPNHPFHFPPHELAKRSVT